MFQALSLAVALAMSPADASTQVVRGINDTLSAPQSLQDAVANGLGAYSRSDYAEAARWFRLAADQGDAEAQTSLGYLYLFGQGVPQNDAEAVRLYRLAADQGFARAQFNLGGMYNAGRGVPQNYAQALRWYRLAADQGEAGAQNNLGSMYANGEGVPQNYVEAYKWFNLAAAQGNANAATNRDRVLALMTPAQIAEGQRLAAEWRPR
jgi:uncharacterized protein